MTHPSLNKLLPILVMVAGLSATHFFQQQTFKTLHQNQQDNFDYQAREIILHINQRITAYGQILRGTQGLYLSSDNVSRAEFHNYVSNLQLATQYPGIQGVGFSQLIPASNKSAPIRAMHKEGFPGPTLRPDGKRDTYTSIIHLEPVTDRNLRAFGYDMYSEAVRRTAMEQARDFDKLAMSGKVKLVQETGQQAQAGFLMYMPVYRNGIPHKTQAERRANLIGWVYSPFRMDDLMQGILGGQAKNIDIEIFDGANATLETLMYKSSGGLANTPQYHSTQQLGLSGRTWTIKFGSLPAFEANTGTGRVTLTQVTGILMSFMMSLLVWSLVKGRIHATNLKESMARALESIVAEESLRKLSMAVEQSPSSIIITDLDANIEYVNASFIKATGYRHDEIIGKNPRLLRSGKTPKATHDDMWATLGRGEVWKGELINKKKEGAEYIESALISPVRQPDGKITHYVGIKEDITERKQAELRLQESEQRFRVIADAAPVLIWMAGADKHCTWFNQTWLDFTGRSMAQELGNGWAAGVHPKDFQGCLDTYISHFDRHAPFRRVYRLQRNDGEYRWIEDHGVPRFEADGTFVGFIGSCTDITEIQQAQKQLQASHDLFTALSRQVPGMVYQYRLFPDGHACFPFASDGIKEIYEVAPEQVCEDASPVFANLHPDDYGRIATSIQVSADTLQPWQLEYRVLLPKKGLRWLSGLSNPEKLEDGSILWHGFITDITGQVNARNEANKTKEMLESVLSSATELSIIAADTQGLITLFNRGAERMLGYTADEMIGKQTPAFFHLPKEAEQRSRELTLELGRPVCGFNAFVEKAAELGQETREWTYVRKDRSTLMVSLVVTTIRNQDNEITGYLGVAEDISERTKIDEERNRLLKIIEDAPDFIAMSDMQAHLKYINTAGAKMVGLPDDVNLSDLEIKDLHPEWGTMLVLDEGIPAVVEKGFWQGENALLHRDGHEIAVSQLLLLHCDAAGNPQFLSTIMRDITVNKQAEQALHQAKDAAENLAKSKSEFLAKMSHEIRTPMNAIIGLSQLALNKDLSYEIRDYLEKIYSSSNNLLGILNDVLDFSKLEAGRLNLEQRPFNLDELLDNINNLFAYPAKEKALDFSMDVAPDVPRGLIGDSQRLQQIIINLLGNAIKFTERGKVTLKITLQQTDKLQVRLLFCVIDTGIGMSAHDREKLFKAFSQVDDSNTRRYGGTGLGLAISQNLLQLMGGEFIVESMPGKGSSFCFELVFGVSSSPSQQPSKTRTPTYEESSNSLAGTRILVAEDNLINQQVVREFLNLCGITVEIANNGQEALALLNNKDFDAVLMDIHMPGMDGFEATRLIRSQARFAALPIIALTAGVTKEEREHCLDSGMDDFIAKPIIPKKLIATLMQWIKPVGATAMDAGPSPTDDTPVFDLRNLSEMLDNNQALVNQLLLNFMENMKNSPDEIAAMISVEDFASARELVHTVKGTSGNIGAVRLHAAAEALETALKMELLATATAQFNKFRAAFNQTLSAIAPPQPEDQTAPTESGNSEALKRAVAELDGLLKNNDFIRETMLDTLKPHLAIDQYDLFAHLRKLIATLKYDEARKVLRQLTEPR
ncbi:MAG: PAS domain S-box protein [Methylovulum sp.]|nr:PAS domain S-box protein [Methylovulum sp.]